MLADVLLKSRAFVLVDVLLKSRAFVFVDVLLKSRALLVAAVWKAFYTHTVVLVLLRQLPFW